MDFISNLIKRPISLVLNETSTTMDKYPISASLPNTPSELENRKDLKPATEANGVQVSNNKRPLSLSSSSCSEDNNMMTDFIGISVPEEFLDEFKDVLPPPPLSLQNANALTQSLLDMEFTRSLSITPPPPPLTPSMKVSQTIDELLSQINDNLQQAGLNDEVLAIASPSNKSELNPLSSKAALNNSKLLASSASTTNTQPNASTKAAGPASLTVFENNASLNKFPFDPELENIFDEKHASKGPMNNSGVNKSSNKFVGLTEFDETKIPELPADLNPNIEEQYSVTFEKCFVPTFKSNQGSDPNEECKVDKMHFLLPTELDATTDNEVFTDCHDDRDPLASTFTEPSSLNVTTDADSFQSAFNSALGSNFNNTMDNIADITLEAEKDKLSTNDNNQNSQGAKIDLIDEDEAMDIDINDTMEMLHNTSNNIQHVEKVLQHAENILKDLDDKKSSEVQNNENVLSQNETDFVVKTLSKSTENLDDGKEKQLSAAEISLNKSIESYINKTKLECSNESLTLNTTPEESIESDINPNLPKDAMNLSNKSNSSAKSAVLNPETDLEVTTSINSEKTSAPSSPSFPMKTTPNAGFPRSPKAVAGKENKSPFLEKSDYLANMDNQNTNIENPSLSSLTENAAETNSAILQPTNTADRDVELRNECQTLSIHSCDNEHKSIEKRRTFNVNTIDIDSNTVNKFPSENKRLTFNANDDVELRNQRQTFSIITLDNEQKPIEKRRTFNMNTTEIVSNTLIKYPCVDKTENTSLNVNANHNTENNLLADKTDVERRRTFNVPLEQAEPDTSEQHTVLNTSFEPMDVDENDISRNSTCSLPKLEEQKKETHTSIDNVEDLESFHSSKEHDSSESPNSANITQKSASTVNTAPNLESSLSRSQSPTLPILQGSNESPNLPSMAPGNQSPPLPAIQSTAQTPPLPDLQYKDSSSLPLSDTMINTNEIKLSESRDMALNIKEEQIPLSTTSSYVSQSLPALIQKRPPIRDARARAADILSAKEQSNTKVKDEKDVFVEKSTPSPPEEVFTGVSATSTTLTNSSEFSGFDQNSSSCSSVDIYGEEQNKLQPTEDEFAGNNNLILNPSDFDYLLTRGNSNAPVARSSLLLKFDPLLGVPVPVNQGQPTNTNNPCLSPTLEEEEHNNSNSSFVTETKPGASAKSLRERSQEVKKKLQLEHQIQQNKRQLTQGADKKNATMSVDVIKDMSLDNDCNKAFENSNSTQSDDKQINYKMDELEKKIKNEVLKTEDIEKKLKDAEQREEALIKRITEKDKTIAKMTGVVEAYEKTIAELIADKEQLTQNYEKQLAEVKADCDSNYHHLMSLETTFSDLHVKYEKSKEMTCQLKENEEALLAEKRKNLEYLRSQEQRYDIMKNHAMQQLEIANKKLESITREHSIEITKLKALLKKEEIARSSINEQLAHKTKENAELVKICDELISGQGSNFSFEPYDPKKH